MEKQEVINFFDSAASWWDADMIKEQWKIDTILDAAGVSAGCVVLDVACGTGVLIPDYLERKTKRIIGVDISSEMIRIAGEKFKGNTQVEFLCGDAEGMSFLEKFDCVMIYNAFPHFCNPEQLIKNLAKHIRTGGTLTVAHGMSRENLTRHHEGRAKEISKLLISEDEMEQLLQSYFDVTVKRSDEDMYLVSGRKR